MRLTKLSGYPIFHVTSDNYWDLAMTFMRAQEWYESPNPRFRGKIFSHEEFMDWYVAHKDTKKARFTYPWDWKGFNVPSAAIRALKYDFRGRSMKEEWLLRELELAGAQRSGGAFYVIGTHERSTANLRHEIHHALFALDPAYRDAVLSVTKRFELTDFRKWVLTHYSEEVLADEMHAYALTGWPPKKELSVSDEMLSLRSALKAAVRPFLLRMRSDGHK